MSSFEEEERAACESALADLFGLTNGWHANPDGREIAWLVQQRAQAREQGVAEGREESADLLAAADREITAAHTRLCDATDELECERMRLAAVGVEAHGGDTSSCCVEYQSDALTSVRAMRAKLAAIEALCHEPEARGPHGWADGFRAWISCSRVREILGGGA
jgi:hypothetical protein